MTINDMPEEEENLKATRESETIPATKERRLIESQTTLAADEKRKNILKVRWSLQDEIAKLFNPALKGALCRWKEGVTCSISPCHKEDGDYLCTNVMETWSELRKTRKYHGSTDVGLKVRRNIMLGDTTGMIERYDASYVVLVF